jgi:Leucine-rich repeat (LRR) protein
MTTSELHLKLQEAYSSQNLNRITVTLINLYKNEQFGTLRQIVEMISDSVEITIDPGNRFFSKLMMLYHPDRGDFHRNEINRLVAGNDHDGLLGYSHILMLGRIEEIAEALTSYEDIDYSPVYEWDLNLEGFSIINTRKSGQAEYENHSKACKKFISFYNAVKLRMFGKTTIGFPTHYFEDLEELELSQSGINDLDGVQYCLHTTTMDLSDNAISDISLLWGLKQIENLNLSDNRIEDIDTLANLRNLKTLVLSNNPIKDVSTLNNLGKLEYVELTGTRVSHEQILKLEEQGITVFV